MSKETWTCPTCRTKYPSEVRFDPEAMAKYIMENGAKHLKERIEGLEEYRNRHRDWHLQFAEGPPPGVDVADDHARARISRLRDDTEERAGAQFRLIQDLKRKIEELQDQLGKSTTFYHEVESGQYAVTPTMHFLLEKRVESQTEWSKKHEKRLEGHDGCIVNQGTQIKNLELNATAANSRLNGLGDRIEALEKRGIQVLPDKVAERLEKLEQDIARHDQWLKDSDSSIGSLVQRTHHQKSWLKQVDSALDGHDHVLIEHHGRVAGQKKRIEALDMQVKDIEQARCNTAIDQTARLTNDEQAARISKANERITTLEGDNRTIRHCLGAATGKADELGDKVGGLENNREDLYRLNRESKERIEKLEKGIGAWGILRMAMNSRVVALEKQSAWDKTQEAIKESSTVQDSISLETTEKHGRTLNCHDSRIKRLHERIGSLEGYRVRHGTWHAQFASGD